MRPLAVFAHANVSIPAGLDRRLRLVVVTPDLHRVHHSAVERESGSNLGSLFPWWDRLLRTYAPAPAGNVAAIRIGLDEFRARKHLGLPWMLLHPFLSADPRAGRRPT